jgi:large subunit ribosomal protein L22
MEVVATAKWVRTTARKARLVAATVEGLPVNDALTILAFTPRAAAIEVAKVIKSAAANAEHNYNLDVSTLRVNRIEIDGATIIKRFQPRAQGRAFSILKRTSHLRAVVSDDRALEEQRPRRRRPAAQAAAPAPAAPAKPESRPARAPRVRKTTTTAEEETTATAAAEAETEE